MTEHNTEWIPAIPNKQMPERKPFAITDIVIGCAGSASCGRNASIDASAGTGKTYTLQQLVALCINEGISLSKILMVTYTEKAAGELRERIRQKIEEVILNNKLGVGAGENDIKLKDIQQFRNAREEIDQADICTIHSFCQKALRMFAYDSGRTMKMDLINDIAIIDLIDRQARDIWPNNKDYQILMNGGDKLISDLKSIMASAVGKYYLNSNGEEDPEIISMENEIPFSNGTVPIDEIIQRFDQYCDFLKKNQNETFKISSDKTTYTFGDFCANIIETDGNYDGRAYQKKYYKGSNEQLPEAFDFFKCFKDSELTKSILIKWRFILQQIPIVYKLWQQEKLENRKQSYADMIAAVYNAISDDNTGLCAKLREKYRIGIIDEFQDTNMMQWKIFKKLFFQCPENPDNQLFVVGDPKQSIYAFQNADVSVYSEATQAFEIKSSLQTNYRSTNRVISACNALFWPGLSGFFTEGNIVFTPSNSPEPAKPDAIYEDRPLPGVLFSDADISSKSFAQDAAKIILQCCSFKEGKTRLQIFDKSTKQLRNVSFKDFAVLARTQSEMADIRKTLNQAGIPNLRYKDSALFSGRECIAWIALFKSIDAPDFAGWNRRILTEALITDFFAIPIQNASDEEYDNPLCPQRRNISEWHHIASQYRWAELLERIYEKTEIQTRLSDLTKLQELSKLRQIGQYAIDYLYTQRCSLNDAIHHLETLYKSATKSDNEDDALVARNSDFDVVQIMTIHASKGLEFPVVISVAGFKSLNNRSKGPWLYHEKKCASSRTTKLLGITAYAKEQNTKETIEEWQRLFYVAFTRASSLLILPRYKNKSEYSFLDNTWAKLSDHEALTELIQSDDWKVIHGAAHNIEELFGEYNQIIPEIKEMRLSSDQDKNRIYEILNVLKFLKNKAVENESGSKELQHNQISKLMKKLPSLSMYQHSYSSLARKASSNQLFVQELNYDETSGKVTGLKGIDDTFDELSDEEIHSYHADSVNVKDKGKPIACFMSSEQTAPIYDKYPCGAKLGTALHEILELTNFESARKALSETADILEQSEKSFRRAGLSLKNDVVENSRQIVWHALNAVLPEIEGSAGTGRSFCLKDLSEKDHFAEVEFELNACPSAGEVLKTYTTGSIDLLFRRGDRYAIADWKSNILPPESMYNQDEIRNNVDEHYSIQRVIYSYCLIHWLHTFEKYKSLTLKEIFDKHFGGIYYIYVRGCCAGTGNGVYAHTWESYQELEASYIKITKLMKT